MNNQTFDELGIKVQGKESFGKVVEILKNLSRPMIVMFEREVNVQSTGILSSSAAQLALSNQAPTIGDITSSSAITSTNNNQQQQQEQQLQQYQQTSVDEMQKQNNY